MSSNIVIPELLVPAGDFDCIRAGVQNGADAIYFGGNLFNARSNAKNFSLEELKEAIKYCKLRNVKTNLTLNTLVSNDEFEDAVNLAKYAFESGIDAIIVQDLGLGKYLIDNIPGIVIHASTQMSVHNLAGVLELEKLGFKRVVLSRELSINEIEYISNNSNVELEVFAHGALCISYSGQCLFSSFVGGRSGNRGKCAQPCRLPYELLEKDESENLNKIDKGYLLSPRDLCSLEYLPQLVSCGVSSLKIEGRMKTPEYVATITRVYRKYLDKIIKKEQYVIEESDKKDLLQAFNRGEFSLGHLSNEPNKDLVFPKKSNNMGLYVGNIANYNANKGYIKILINEQLAIGDTISIGDIDYKYTISELLKDNQNIKIAPVKTTVTIGRMKGNIFVGQPVYKLSSKSMESNALSTYSENSNIKKIPINISLSVKENMPITAKIDVHNPPFYKDVLIRYESNVIPEKALKTPITDLKIIEQFSKLGNTQYSINKIKIDLDKNLFVNITDLNNIRRDAILALEQKVMDLSLPKKSKNNFKELILKNDSVNNININNRKTSILIQDIKIGLDYSKIENVDNIYIPLKYFVKKEYEELIYKLTNKFKIYIYMPTIIKTNYRNILLYNLDDIVSKYNIKGFVISNVAGFIFLEKYLNKDNYDIVTNYTLNIFNKYSINELSKLGVKRITPSIELNSEILNSILETSNLPCELIAYGKAVLMNSSYCLLGKTNKCYPECEMKCKTNNKYYLKDRLGFRFRILPDNMQTVTSIFNSKITSIQTSDLKINSVRIDILDENIDEINSIVKTVRTGSKLEGNEYTNGNLNRSI